MANNKLYRTQETVIPRFWRDLQVRYDSLKDNQSREQFKSILINIGQKELGELSSALSLPIGDNKEQMIDIISGIEAEQQLLISLLRDFTNRRKNTIIQFYDLYTEGKEKVHVSPTVQLYSLYMESPSILYEIFTFHMWSMKGTGALLSSESTEKKVQHHKAMKIATEQGFQESLCNTLYKRSGEKNKYRIYSYAAFHDRVIFLLYKCVNDTSIPDFEENVRNQEVNAILYQINSNDQTIEMKDVTLVESQGIKQHAEETFDTKFTLLKTEVFREYDASVFRDAVLKGATSTGRPVDDFLIDRITFRGSPLKNAPEVTLQLKDLDIWPSVIDAHEKSAVNVKSLKDIAYLSVHSSNTSRTIRSIIKDNGNIVFSMDDSRMDATTKERIGEKFQEKFGIPLFQEITNDKFVAGKTDLYNYVLSQSSPSAIIEPEEQQAMQELEDAGLLTIMEEQLLMCENDECDFEERFSGGSELEIGLEECPKCKEHEFRMRRQRLIQKSMKHLTGAVRNQLEHLCVDEEWVILKESSRKFGSMQYRFYNYERTSDGRQLQILITDQVVPGRVVKQLIKQMTPLIIIFVGKHEKDIEVYNKDCIQAMTFGEIFALNPSVAKEHINKLYKDLELRSKNYIASAAYEANLSISRHVGIDPIRVSPEYSDTEFEDDVYCILKDIFVNTVKWGQEKKGQAVPEGVFTISFRKKKGNLLVGHKNAFSFDCKLTRLASGYELKKDEQRKAADYVDLINNSDYIASYATNNQLTAHVFISNKIKPSQVEGMIQYFKDRFLDDFDAVPVFVESEVLIDLHSWYRQNEETLRQVPNNFMGLLLDLFRKPGSIKREDVIAMQNKALDPSLRELNFLNVDKLSKEITE